jgi:endonuclease I
MSAGHIQRSYGDFRFSAAIHDQDPANSSRIILAYSGLSNSSAWDSAATWNREHVWPQSKQPGSASNGTQGNLGDPHALRPCNTRVNSDRGSMPFGFGSTTGTFDDLGTYWFVGDGCRGDIARSLFYSDTRWTSLGISLANGNPSGNRMGDLESLIQWHYLDPPDEFELRRNHTIFSSQFNPRYYTNNRNAFVDRPEFVWSIYKDQMNDSTITVAGGSSNANGSSLLAIDFGTVIVGTPVTPSQTITLDKAGNDGTYYLVESVGDATSDAEGDKNAFRMNGTDSRSINVSLAFNQQTAGMYDGMIVIDNLDVTTQGGLGNGANDGNDLVDLSLKVLDHSNASFANNRDLNSLTINLGEVPQGQPIAPIDLQIYNLASDAGAALTAKMNFVSAASLPQGSFLTFSDSTFADLPAGQAAGLSIEGTPVSLGAGVTQFQFRLSDEEIPGARQQTLQLTINYDVIDAFLLGDVNIDGVVNFSDIPSFIDVQMNQTYLEEADCNQDGLVDFEDIPAFIALLTAQ